MGRGSELGIGIIGSGFMGRTYSECLARYTKRARLVAVAGGRRAPKLAEDYGVDHVETVEGLSGRSDLDGVIITSPEMFHLQHTCVAAAAGKHVLVEKPMAPDLRQCDAMIDACRKSRATLMVIQSQRFRAVHRRAHELLEEGRIGRVLQIRHWAFQSEAQSRKEAVAKPFYLDPAGGGLYLGYNVHCFDMVRWMAGAEGHSVFATVGSFGDHGLPDLSTMAQIQFVGGTVAQLWTSTEMRDPPFAQSRFHTQVFGTRGLLDFDGYSHLDLSTEKGWERVCEQAPLDLRDPADPVRLEAYSAMVQAFIDAVIENKEPPVTGEDGRRAVELCLAARESARAGRVVSLA